MTRSTRRQEEIFSEAMALPRDDRRGFVERVCAPDTELRDAVLGLLRAAHDSGAFLETPPTLLSAARDRSVDPLAMEGARIGHYVLKRILGEGGAGVVFEAEQVEPVRRHVALKIMKGGLDTDAAVVRFEAERQVLAMMDHPNIARVLDAGAAPDGRLFFAMELVDGVKITDYCDRERLSVPARLEIFARVCAAVQHAHQKGVIHRDLKPSNILVATIDGVAVPKVIDFGIAKATQACPARWDTVTRLGNLIGTPAYMSPEQAEIGSHAIDTRTDIFSLGVILYELLTGMTPFAAGELARVGFDAVQRAVLQREAVRPSSRLETTAHGQLASIATLRRAEPAKLIRCMRGDLDWVVLKAMERDRERRYATARELVTDVERHLRDEPVTARPPSARYRIGRFLRRHRMGVSVATMATVMLALTALISTVLAVRATRAERQAHRVMHVLQEMLDGMGQTAALGPITDMERSGREWYRVLDETAAHATAGLADEPLVEAEVRQIFAKINTAAARYPQAEDMLRKAIALREAALGRDHPDTIQARYELGMALWMDHRIREGDEVVREVLEARRRTLGREHPETVRVQEILAFNLLVFGDPTRAEPLFRETVEIRTRTGRLDDFDNQHHAPLEGLAQCLLALNRYDEGEVYARRNLNAVLRDGDATPLRISNANLLLAWALKSQERSAEALPYARAARDQTHAVYDARHPLFSHTSYELANCLAMVGGAANLAEAEALYRQVINDWRALNRGRDSNVLVSRIETLAGFLARQGRFDEAAPLIEESWALCSTCTLATCVDYEAQVLRTGILLYEAWSERDSTRGVGIAQWRERLDTFQAKVRAMEPGAFRTAAVRGLSRVLTEWSATESAWGEAAAFWRAELVRCEQAMLEQAVE